MGYVQSKLRTNACEEEMKYEPHEKFCERICSTLLNFSTEIIESIQSMQNWINLVLAGKGYYTRY